MHKLLFIAFSILYLGNVSGQVTVYDLPNFQGTNKTFRLGTFRMIAEPGLNDKISSIKVPPGMGIIIYEDANETGGAGDYVDLLEDCNDLSVYYFNNRVSYINVFMIERPLHIWIRNRKVDDLVIPGHWERKRANGKKPDNSPPAIVYSNKRVLKPIQSNLPMMSQFLPFLWK